jgi:hypothetical protein
LEGGFLSFKNGNAAFVNPSVKDFLDATIAQDIEHLDDLLSGSCLFEQIVNIWNLVGSEKGSQIQQSLLQSPGKLIAAITRNLHSPHELKIRYDGGGIGTRPRDVRPEVRLGTMVSVAERTKSQAAIDQAMVYSQDVIKFWSKNIPDFEASVNVLGTLDAAKWRPLKKANIHAVLKTALLSELQASPKAADILAVGDYASAAHAQWTTEDRTSLAKVVEVYLEDEFDVEFADRNRDLEALQGFYETLEGIGRCCGVSVALYAAQVAERIDELLEPNDDDDRPVQRWEDSRQTIPEATQEAEVRRLFDGFQ